MVSGHYETPTPDMYKAVLRDNERLRHDIERHIAMASELATENERLRDELAEARRDAERYQWLRKQFYSDSNNRTPHISQYPDPSGEYVQLTAGVDAAIDAAMAGGA